MTGLGSHGDAWQRVTSTFQNSSTAFKTFVTTPSPARTAAATTAAAVLAFYALGKFNSYYSRRVLNNWNPTRQWNWHVPGKEIVLITGGSSGIGELAARKLAAQGIKVAAMDLKPPKNPFPPNVSFYHADVTSSKAVKEAAEKIRQEVGHPTVLVNNAGIGSARAILDETEQETRRTFDVNVLGHFNTIREFLPAMIKADHGHVVTVASMASFVTIAGNTDYSCTKAGALALHEGLGQELKWRYNAPNVRTSIVHPTWVRTPLIADLLKVGEWKDNLLELEPVADAIVKQILKGESGQVILPKSYNVVGPLVRAMPSWMQEKVRDSKHDVLANLEEHRMKMS